MSTFRKYIALVNPLIINRENFSIQKKVDFFIEAGKIEFLLKYKSPNKKKVKF
jgi:hypothetical protein